MQGFTPSSNNVAYGFTLLDGESYYYGDVEVRRYLQKNPSGLNIHTDSEGILHFDPVTSSSAPSALFPKRVVLNPQSVGLQATEAPTMTILQ